MIQVKSNLISGKTDTGFLLGVVMVVATIIRLWGLTAFSLSNDELSALARLQYGSISDVLKYGVYTDFHPAGVQLFLYGWTHLFGFSEWVVRIPFALMGIGSVYLLYRIGKLWFGTAVGLLAAASLAVLEFPILYSQIARPYSPGLFFSLMATFFWTKSLFDQEPSSGLKRILNFVGFVLSVSACMYIHYFSFIFVGMLCFAGIFFVKKNTWLPYFISGFFIVLLYIPHLDIFLHQLSKGGVGGAEGWLGPPGPDAFGKYLDYCFNDSYKLKLIFFIIFAGLILNFRGQIKAGKFHLLAVIFFGVPFAIAYYYSIWKNPVFQHSVLLFSFPYLLLIIFSFIPREKTGTTLKILLYSVLIGGTYSTVAEKKYYSTAHFSEFRELASRVKELDNKLGEENITKVINVFSPYYIQYYLDYFNHKTNFSQTSILSKEEIQSFHKLVEESKTPYFLYSFSNMYDDPELDLVIRSKYPWVIVKDSMLNSGLRLYSITGKDSALNSFPYFEYQNDFEKGEWKDEANFRDSTTKYNGNYSVHLGNGNEYGPTFQMKLSDLKLIPGSKIEISSAFFTEQEVKSAKLVLSVEKNGKSLIWIATNLEKYVIEKNKWSRAFLTTTLPNELSGDEELKIYSWNEKKEDYYMDGFKMSVFEGR